jgi:hypothetical protein
MTRRARAIEGSGSACRRVDLALATLASQKTYNDAISALRRAFALDLEDHPKLHNPARAFEKRAYR